MSVKSIVKKVFHNSGYTIVPNKSLPFYFSEKYQAEIGFWKIILQQYIRWYNGQITELYEEASPSYELKIKEYDLVYNAILTWQKLHQRPKYLEDLQLQNDVFEGMKVLDIGSGPHPSALCFDHCEIYCLDPLLPLYMEAGFPIHIYDSRTKFVYGFSEKMPFEDHFFDAIISVNALDHVDDFALTAEEIKRVLKPGGKVRLHLHFHPKTVTEPLELNDTIVSKAFGWCPGFKKIHESKSKRGYTIMENNETFSLWTNF